MEQLIIYCHGFGSSSNSSKLQKLRDAGLNAFCFTADIDPTKAFQVLTNEIDSLLIDYLHRDIKLVFVGTSLGGWTAALLAKTYHARAVIINPSINPALSLLKHEVPIEVCVKYQPIITDRRYEYFFAEYDEVLDNESYSKSLIEDGFNVTVVPGADHRFEKHFDLIVNLLKTPLPSTTETYIIDTTPIFK